MSQLGWEARILAVLASCRAGVGEQEAAEAAEVAEDESVAIDVVSVLVQHLLMEGAWESVARVHATLTFFGERGHLQTPAFYSKLLCGRVAEQLGAEATSVAAVCRGNPLVTQAVVRWLKLAESHLFIKVNEEPVRLVPATQSMQWSLAMSQLCETVVLVMNEQSDFDLWSQVLRVSLLTMEQAFRLLESADIVERERKMGEMEAVLLSGMDRIAQPMVDALSEYKQEKTRGWRVEEEQSSAVFNLIAKRIQNLAPQFGARFQQQSVNPLVCVGATLVNTLVALAAMGSVNVRKDGMYFALHATAVVISERGVIPTVPALRDQGSAQLLMELFSTEGPFGELISKARQAERRAPTLLSYE